MHRCTRAFPHHPYLHGKVTSVRSAEIAPSLCVSDLVAHLSCAILLYSVGANAEVQPRAQRCEKQSRNSFLLKKLNHMSE